MSRDELMYLQDIVESGIDNNILWDVVRNKIPPLLAVISAYLRGTGE